MNKYSCRDMGKQNDFRKNKNTLRFFRQSKRNYN